MQRVGELMVKIICSWCLVVLWCWYQLAGLLVEKAGKLVELAGVLVELPGLLVELSRILVEYWQNLLYVHI